MANRSAFTELARRQSCAARSGVSCDSCLGFRLTDKRGFSLFGQRLGLANLDLTRNGMGCPNARVEEHFATASELFGLSLAVASTNFLLDGLLPEIIDFVAPNTFHETP